MNSREADRPNQAFISVVSLSFITLLLLTTWIYWPGLDGRFVLDDVPNLSTLATINSYAESAEHQQYTNTRFWLFVSEGIASSLGRPVSLISFALQAHNWPANPWAFKYVNLMIHLINGCLVMLLCVQITKLLRIKDSQAYTLSLITTAFWLLHPIHTGTVFYVIQRMTELSAMFTLAGLIAYIHGRSLCLKNKHKHIKGLVWMSAGILLGLILGILSKENAMLLVVYVLAIESTLFHALPKPQYWKAWRFIFLLLPILLLLGYFASDIQGRIFSAYAIRDFTPGERLLTETRILWEYILKIIIPNPNNFSLFHDNYPISTSFIQPFTTVLASMSLITLILTAIYFRKRAIVYSFAVFWFFGGHLLESTAIGLELYFDHRNYLPALGILFAISYYLIASIYKTQKVLYKWLVSFLILAWFSLFSLITYNESILWKNPHDQAITWLQENPDSKRARLNAASTYFELGYLQKTIHLLESISHDWPDDSGTYAHRIHISCLRQDYNYIPPEKDLHHLENSRFDRGTLNALQAITELYEKSTCINPDYESLQSFINAILQNQEFNNQYKDFHYVLGRLHASQGLLSPAIAELDKSYKIKPDVYVAMNQAQWLASAHLFDEAIKYLEKAEKVASSSRLKKKLFTNVLNEWKKDILIEKDQYLHQSQLLNK